MVKLTRDMVCPSCGVADFTRKHRRFWMRWWRRSRLYQCRHCRERILLLPKLQAADAEPSAVREP